MVYLSGFIVLDGISLTLYPDEGSCNMEDIVYIAYCKVEGCDDFYIGHTICSRFMKCGKCCSFDHETRTCTVQPDKYKCAHCGENHITGSRSCRVIKEKVEEITSRTHYGY